MSQAARCWAVAVGAGALLGAAPAPAAPDEIVSTLCAACHGLNGNSAVPEFPSLAGQQAAYLAKQLDEYLSGRRKSDAMTPAVEAIKPADVPALAAYYAAQKPAPGKAGDPALTAAGKNLYEEGNAASGVPGCVGCHMEKGAGFERFPRIAGLHPTYVIQQMNDFKSGARRNDIGRVMRVVAERMSENEIRAVAEYLAAP